VTRLFVLAAGSGAGVLGSAAADASLSTRTGAHVTVTVPDM